MSETLEYPRVEADRSQPSTHPPTVFVPWRLYAYGFILAAFYCVFFLSLYRAGIWLVDSKGVPINTDFTNFWIAGLQALRGQTALLCDPVEITRLQQALVGTGHYVFDNWPYPPTFLLFLAPFSALPYFPAFLTWDLITLLGCSAVVYLIVRRPWAIALLLASPFTIWNLSNGQDGLLTATLLGASLYFLKRHPLVAGLLMGCLTFKPHLGILLPVALAAANQWRAFGAAATAGALLTCAAMAAFGTEVWAGFPAQLFSEADESLFVAPDKAPIANTGLQTVYGLIRALHGSISLAFLGQLVVTFGLAIIVWFLWRSTCRYSIKAAVVSAAALIATPHAYAYDFVVTSITLAFLAQDQIRFGLLRGEQTIALGMLAGALVILVSFGSLPLGPIIIITLLSLAWRRDLSCWEPGRPPVRIFRKFCEMIPSSGN